MNIGVFLISFLIVAFVLFMAIKGMNPASPQAGGRAADRAAALMGSAASRGNSGRALGPLAASPVWGALEKKGFCPSSARGRLDISPQVSAQNISSVSHVKKQLCSFSARTPIRGNDFSVNCLILEYGVR
jgi:hypothetical protein